MYKREETKQRDMAILRELYRFRILTIDQLVSRFEYTKGSMYHFISRLIKSGFVLSKATKGYTKYNNRMKGKYYKITNKGINFLKENGYDLSYTAEDLKVSDLRVQTELTFNNLYFDFSSRSWSVIGSRETKKKYGINRGDNLNGVLSSPVLNDYPFYIFLENTTEKWLKRVVNEVNKYSFSDIILFTVSKNTFEQVMNEMLNNADVFTYSTFRIMPQNYGTRYMLNYVDNDNLYNYLEDMHDIYRVDREADEYYAADLDIVDYNCEEYYLVNLLDHNLVNVHKSKYYTKEKYERDGRKLLVLSNNTVNYEDILQEVHHVDYLRISTKELMNYVEL